jgi:hypothetical protein
VELEKRADLVLVTALPSSGPCLVGRLRKVPFEVARGVICDVIASSPSLERQLPTRSAVLHLLIRRIMRLLYQHIARTTRCVRYNNPLFIFARYLASTHPTYEPPQTSSKVSGHDA